jgi:hypothetical protein
MNQPILGGRVVEVSVVLVAELGDEDAMLPHRIGESTRGHW